MSTVGPPGGGSREGRSKSILEKPHFKRFAAKIFSNVSMRFSKGQKGSVKLTFTAFLHRYFSSRYIMVHGGCVWGVRRQWALRGFRWLTPLDPCAHL